MQPITTIFEAVVLQHFNFWTVVSRTFHTTREGAEKHGKMVRDAHAEITPENDYAISLRIHRHELTD